MSDQIVIPDSTVDAGVEPRMRVLRRSLDTALGLASHTFIMILCLCSIWLIQVTLKTLLGPDAKFFDLVPVRYIIEIGDLIVIAKFLWELIKNFGGREEDT